MANQDISFAQINDAVVRSLVVTGRNYYITLAVSILVTFACFVGPWFYQLRYGFGAAGMNHPTLWGLSLINI